MNKLLPLVVSPFFLLGPICGSAQADSGYSGIHPFMNSRLQIGAGSFFGQQDITTNYRRSANGGTDVSTSDFGLDETVASLFTEARWRMTDRWRIEANFYGIGNSNRREIEKTIEWGDVDFEAGTRVKMKLDTDVFRTAVGYSFMKDDRVELGAGIGIHYLNLDVTLSGNTTVNGETVLDTSRKGSLDGFAPNLAFYGGYAFSDQWMLTGRVDWMSASIDKIDGDLLRLGANILYQPFEHLGFGIGYDYLDANITYTKGDKKVSVDGNIQGPAVFVTLSFF